MAAATALEFGVDLDAIVTAAARLKPSSRRGAVLKLPKGVTVIDDSYNSSPSALQRSLDVIARSWGTRRVAVVPAKRHEPEPLVRQGRGRIELGPAPEVRLGLVEAAMLTMAS